MPRRRSDCLPPRAPNYTPYASRFGSPGRALDRERRVVKEEAGA
jgi:hypothetical protein